MANILDGLFENRSCLCLILLIIILCVCCNFFG